MFNDQGCAAQVLGRADSGVPVRTDGGQRIREVHPALAAAVEAAITAGGCRDAARHGFGLAYEAVAEAQSRTARQHLAVFVGAGR